MTFSDTDVAVIGAGPYGLSLATHLSARGVDHRIFGRPMHAWATMSPGMYLKSLGFATRIYTPHHGFELTRYCLDRGLESVEPIEIATFTEYGVWVQRQLVPYLEETHVVHVERRGQSFILTVATGEQVQARRVVNAIGLTGFERMPRELASLSPELASHTAQHSDFSRLAGRRVAVIGAGQSALQAAALLHEHGAEVQMCVRGPEVHIGETPSPRPLKQRLLNPASVLGPGRKNWALQHFPMLLHCVPDEKRVDFTRRYLGPAGAWWLRDRVVDCFPINLGMSLCEATGQGNGVRLRFRQAGGDERILSVDHVVAGTGYHIDVDAISYLDPELGSSVARIAGAPRLSRHFESSVPGLYFIGPASMMSFGSLYRFVAGANPTVRILSRRLQNVRVRHRVLTGIAPNGPAEPYPAAQR